MDMAQRVVDYVARGESGGRYWAQNRNDDKQGLSFGFLQWAQRPGSLGILLKKMRARDTATFDRIFGGSNTAKALIATTTETDELDRLAPVSGALLWEEPWTSAFHEAGHHPAFQEAQRELAMTGHIYKTSLQVVELLGVRTERAHVLAYDRSNHGPVLANKVANALVDAYNRSQWPTDPRQILADYALSYASVFWSRHKPDSGDWRKVGDAWHKFTGSADLYAIVVKRTAEILTDGSLSDEPVVLV